MNILFKKIMKGLLLFIVMNTLGCAAQGVNSPYVQPLFDHSRKPTYKNTYDYYKGSRKDIEMKEFNKMIKDIYGRRIRV